jgi:hypothetical protein
MTLFDCQVLSGCDSESHPVLTLLAQPLHKLLHLGSRVTDCTADNRQINIRQMATSQNSKFMGFAGSDGHPVLPLLVPLLNKLLHFSCRVADCTAQHIADGGVLKCAAACCLHSSSDPTIGKQQLHHVASLFIV